MFNLNKGESINSFHFVVPTDAVDLEKEILEVEAQLDFAKSMIPEWEKKLEIFKCEYEEKNWMKTNHEKVFDGLELSANYSNWELTKERYKNDNNIGIICYVDKDNSSDDGLTVHDAKELIKYLQQKIDYLEEK